MMQFFTSYISNADILGHVSVNKWPQVKTEVNKQHINILGKYSCSHQQSHQAACSLVAVMNGKMFRAGVRIGAICSAPGYGASTGNWLRQRPIRGHRQPYRPLPPSLPPAAL